MRQNNSDIYLQFVGLRSFYSSGKRDNKLINRVLVLLILMFDYCLLLESYFDKCFFFRGEKQDYLRFISKFKLIFNVELRDNSKTTSIK